MNHIMEFQGEHRWLSNFIGGVEQKYQAAKCLSETDRDRILEMSPAAAKKAGKSVVIRPDWETNKKLIMLLLLREKFFQHEYRTLLLATGSVLITEGNTWGDQFWGICKKTGRGHNYLGRLIMKVRAELKLIDNVPLTETDSYYLGEEI